MLHPLSTRTTTYVLLIWYKQKTHEIRRLLITIICTGSSSKNVDFSILYYLYTKSIYQKYVVSLTVVQRQQQQ